MHGIPKRGANEPPSEQDLPVTVRTFAREDERMPVEAFLQAEGVRTIRPHGHVLSLDPSLYVAMGFYKLQVPSSQRELALALLAEWDDADPLPENVDTGEWTSAMTEPIPRIGRDWPGRVVQGMLLLWIAFMVWAVTR